MKIRIRMDSFWERNSLLWWVPYLLVLIVFNMLAAWWLIDLTGLGWVPEFQVYFDMRMFQIDFPGKWIAFPAAGLALIEHLILQMLFEFAD